MRAMDELDEHLLSLLEAEGRLTMAELGRRVGLSRTATLARVRSLEDAGVIRGYHAAVDRPSTRGTHEAVVGLVVRTADQRVYVRRLQAFPELVQVESVAGELDLIARFATDGAARLDEILDRINGWRETLRTTTFIVLRRYA
jgi:Lrp/AsnC family transcriptional regulator, leucine-responsive regulatory protein